MKIKRLEVQDFRSYPSHQWDFTANQIVFCGSNGKGKTNVLEAISLLSVGKSWREHTASDLIYDQAATESFSAHIKATNFLIDF